MRNPLCNSVSVSFSFLIIRLLKQIHDGFSTFILIYTIISVCYNFFRVQSVTTYNTSIISNDVLRPDCYFLMHKTGVHSLANSTVKELRKAHNIEKMYKAGVFGG